MKTLVIFPTRDESKYFEREGAVVGFCEVGLIASTYNTSRLIKEHTPDVVIMGGIAGVYKTSPYKIGDVTLVSKERIADLGFFNEKGFKDFSKMALDMSFDRNIDLVCPHIKEDMPFKLAVSNSMNCAMAPFVDIEGVDIENMEGAGFFYACEKEGVKYFEVRSISNEVDFKHDNWDYETSIRIMTKGVNDLIDYLENENNN